MIFSETALQNKKILITGASSGIGRQIALFLSGLGAQCLITGRDIQRLEETLKQLKNSDSLMIPTELTDDSALQSLFETATKDGKKLDGLVYSAGVIPTIPLRVMNRQKMIKVFDVNFFSFLETVKKFSKNCNSDSSIIGISSIAAVQPEKCQSLYAATKAAMNTAAQSLAFELAEKKITINTIMPGLVSEPTKQNSEEVERLSQNQLLGVVEPENVAYMVAYLLSDFARKITGRFFYCDGGRLK